MTKYTSDVIVGKVEKNIPVLQRIGKQYKYPFGEMEINDSFNVDIGTMKYQYIYGSIHNSFKNWKRHDIKYKDWKIIVRKIDDKNIRCWRIN